MSEERLSSDAIADAYRDVLRARRWAAHRAATPEEVRAGPLTVQQAEARWHALLAQRDADRAQREA